MNDQGLILFILTFFTETQPLAVETKMSADISAESSPRSEQSADKSGDSGISGDHAHSDHRVDSPSRHHVSHSVLTLVKEEPHILRFGLTL